MTRQFNGNQLSTIRLGSTKINKIMLGLTEVFPRVVPPIITSVPGGAPVFTQYQAIVPFQFSTIGGIPPYVYTIVAGALPTGINMTTGGYFTGTPTVAGPFNVTFRTTDSEGRYSDQEYSGHVVEASGVWTPYDLFSPTDVGFWWDLDDLGWTDTSLVLGVEVNPQPEFDASAGWVVGSNNGITGGQFVANNGWSSGQSSYASALVSGKTYFVEFEVSEFIGVGSFQVRMGNSPSVDGVITVTGAGIYRAVLSNKDLNTGNRLAIECTSAAGFSMKMDYLRVKEVLSGYNPILFQDASGATAVTVIEQPLGLVLDKSKGLARGAPVVVVDTDTTAGWNGDAVRSISVAGNFVGTSNPTWGIYYPIAPMATEIGKSYEISFTVVGSTSLGGARLGTYASGQDLGGTNVLKLGVNTLRFTAKTTTSYFWMQNGSAAGGYTELKDITFNTLAGNHYSQATAGKRSVWRARQNRIYSSEQFDTTGWNKANMTVVANASVAPNGTMTADAIVDDSTAGEHTLTSASNTVSLLAPRRHSIYAKQDTARYLIMNGYNSVSGNWSCVFDLQTGTVTQDDGNIYFGQAIMENAGDGWWRCSASTDSTSANLGYFTFGISNGPTRAESSYAGTGKRLYVWGAQCEWVQTLNSSAGTYQRIALTTDYDPVGFAKYAEGDGVDDCFVVNGGSTFDLTSTDKAQIFGGVASIRSTPTGMVFELSATGVAQGTINQSVNSDFSVQGWHSNSTGTASANGATRAYSTDYKVGANTLLTISHDIEASLSRLAVNRVYGVDGVGPKGTGNFGNHPAFVMARNQASVYTQLKLFQYVFLGRLATTDETIKTENFIADKIGVTLP